MRMLSDWKHWRTVGLALLVGACSAIANRAGAQEGPFNSDAPRSMAFPGPAPMDCDSSRACDAGMDSGSGLFGAGMLRGPFGGHFGSRLFGSSGHTLHSCGPMGCGPYGGAGLAHGPMACGPAGCGQIDDGLLGNGPLSRLLPGNFSSDSYCGHDGCWGCGRMGCGRMGCGAGGCLAGLSGVRGHGALFSGAILSHLMGPLAPYSDGAASQRWFDVYAGTIAWARSTSVGQVSSPVQDLAQTSPVFETTDLISTIGVGPGDPALRTSDLSLDRFRYGLELVGNIQTGPGANIEVRYFGLNNWNDTASIQRGDPELFSIFSLYGTDPGGVDPGFDDTDRSFIHQIGYDSKFDNGEINYRRRWMGPNSVVQGSWMGGVRYFELDERFGFAAVGSNDDTFTFDQLRFFNMDTNTRNNMVGFQLGADLWFNLIPGIAIGNDFRAGIFNNQAKVDTLVVANSVPGATEVLRKENAAFLLEYSAQAVYRVTHSWSVRSAFNLMYVDRVALAPNNFNSRDMADAIGGEVFGLNRFPFIDTRGSAFYYGYSFGAEYMW